MLYNSADFYPGQCVSSFVRQSISVTVRGYAADEGFLYMQGE